MRAPPPEIFQITTFRNFTGIIRILKNPVSLDALLKKYDAPRPFLVVFGGLGSLVGVHVLHTQRPSGRSARGDRGWGSLPVSPSPAGVVRTAGHVIVWVLPAGELRRTPGALSAGRLLGFGFLASCL